MLPAILSILSRIVFIIFQTWSNIKASIPNKYLIATILRFLTKQLCKVYILVFLRLWPPHHSIYVKWLLSNYDILSEILESEFLFLYESVLKSSVLKFIIKSVKCVCTLFWEIEKLMIEIERTYNHQLQAELTVSTHSF